MTQRETWHVMMWTRAKLDTWEIPPHVSVAFLLHLWHYAFMQTWHGKAQTQLFQLTHCWLGMATEVSTSAMAPNIWSVRPWFFCRAFILPDTKQKLNLKLYSSAVVAFNQQVWQNLSSPLVSAPSALTANGATVWSRATAAHPVQTWHAGHLAQITKNWSCKWRACLWVNLGMYAWTGTSELCPLPEHTHIH